MRGRVDPGGEARMTVAEGVRGDVSGELGQDRLGRLALLSPLRSAHGLEQAAGWRLIGRPVRQPGQVVSDQVGHLVADPADLRRVPERGWTRRRGVLGGGVLGGGVLRWAGLGWGALVRSGPGRRGHGRGASLSSTSGTGPGWTTPSRWVALVIATYRSLRPRGDSPRIWAGSAISTESNSSPLAWLTVSTTTCLSRSGPSTSAASPESGPSGSALSGPVLSGPVLSGPAPLAR